MKNRVVVMITVIFSLLAVPFGTDAQPNPPLPTPPGTVKVQMRLDCTHLTELGRQYVKAHHLCGTGTNGGIVPNSVVSDNCGTAYIFIQRVGSGFVAFNIGANSTLGPIAYVSWSVSFSNLYTEQSGSIGGSQVGLSNSWEIFTSPATYTGTGLVSATLNGGVTLVYSLYCGFDSPNDYALVS